MAIDENQVDKQLNDQEELFVEMYLLHNQKAIAARLAGYSEHSDRQTGWIVYNRPNVKARIEKLLEDRAISGAQALKIVSDMAEFNLSDYFAPRASIEVKKVKKGLQQLIDEEKEFIRKQELFIERKGLTEKAFDEAHAKLQWRHDQILLWEIELEANPNAFQIVDGEPELVERMELDIDAVVADKAIGKIKSVKYTKDGIQIEAYDAKDAATTLLKVHGKFEKDNAQKKNEIHIQVNQDDAQLGS